jgi:hypothetical protein
MSRWAKSFLKESFRSVEGADPAWLLIDHSKRAVEIEYLITIVWVTQDTKHHVFPFRISIYTKLHRCFVEFLEMICRVADVKFKTGDLDKNMLHKNLEIILDEMFVVLGKDRTLARFERASAKAAA